MDRGEWPHPAKALRGPKPEISAMINKNITRIRRKIRTEKLCIRSLRRQNMVANFSLVMALLVMFGLEVLATWMARLR
jgi:hypothetical protein